MKYIILTLSLFFSFSLSGQHMMLTGDITPRGTGLIVDYPGAAAAYSLRNLTSLWGGNAVIKVRESGSNTEQDFTATEVTDGTLSTFCGSNDGFVVTWYDQSGNGYNAIQSTTSNQPQIVSNGQVIFENGNPTLKFDGTDDYFTSIASYNQPFTYFVISKSFSVSVDKVMIDGSYSLNFVQLKHHQPSGRIIIFAGSILQGLAHNTNQNLHYALYNGSSSQIGLNNGAASSGNAGTNSPTGLTIGSRLAGTGQFWDGNIQEMILYSSDQSANRSGIESNINAYYSIY